MWECEAYCHIYQYGFNAILDAHQFFVMNATFIPETFVIKLGKDVIDKAFPYVFSSYLHGKTFMYAVMIFTMKGQLKD
jgi:hypothetical protein